MTVTTIDGAGRIVVPKALRDALGLTPGTELEIMAADGLLEISPLPTPMRPCHRSRRSRCATRSRGSGADRRRFERCDRRVRLVACFA